MFKLPKIKLVFEERSEEHNPAKYDNLHSAVSLSFARVREDTSRIFEWLDYLHSQNIEQQKLIHLLKKELTSHQASAIAFNEAPTQMIVKNLGFELTGAQKKCAWQILC